MADPSTYPWLDPDTTRDWLQIADTSPLSNVAEWCREASAAYCQRQRPDLLTTDLTDPANPVVTFSADPDVVMAGLIGAARLYARRSTPTGLASFGEFGASDILRLDPDVARLLGTGRYAAPVIR